MFFSWYTYFFYVAGLLFGFFFHTETMLVFMISAIMTVFIVMKRYIDDDAKSLSQQGLPYFILAVVTATALVDHFRKID